MSVAEQIELACLMEATARKPGNVHPTAAFDDLCYEDFVRAAQLIAEPVSMAGEAGVGRAVRDAVHASVSATGTNVNLGVVLLLAPLIAVPAVTQLEAGIESVLERLTVDDAKQVYEAIRLASPGGMGQVASQDVHEQPTVTLREAMKLAADRDRIAEQYANGFKLVFEARDWFCAAFEWEREATSEPRTKEDWESAVILLHLWILSRWPDTLIARKCGPGTAEVATKLAQELMQGINPKNEIDQGLLNQFDVWLREDGHRRNPGTTADLVAATLFASMRDGLIIPPTRDEVLERANAMRSGCSGQ